MIYENSHYVNVLKKAPLHHPYIIVVMVEIGRNINFNLISGKNDHI
jgi:hypothetical protein